jgi:voltage-gated potassium channel
MWRFRTFAFIKRRFAQRAHVIFYTLRRSQLLKVMAAIFLVAIVAAAGITLFEYASNPQFASFGDGLWWAVVTIATVGYGDKVPTTCAGRVIATIVMFAGVALFSFFTASIASLVITTRMKEGKGLSKIGFKNHVAILGWNSSGEKIIASILEELIQQNKSLVLVNQMPPEVMEQIILRFHGLQIKFVYGDITDELVLNRANLRFAYAAMIIPDESAGMAEKADERTVLATLSVKSIEPRVRVISHILNAGNEAHLRRANADQVVKSDQFSGFLLGAHVISPGIPELLDVLLGGGSTMRLSRCKVPNIFIGKTFAELLNYYKKEENSILLGFIQEEPEFRLDDILSDDYSAIDNFIRDKIQEAGKGLSKKAKIEVELNPPDDYRIQEHDIAVVIGGA